MDFYFRVKNCELFASKAFDRLCNNKLFTMLIERNISPFVIGMEVI